MKRPPTGLSEVVASGEAWSASRGRWLLNAIVRLWQVVDQPRETALSGLDDEIVIAGDFLVLWGATEVQGHFDQMITLKRIDQSVDGSKIFTGELGQIPLGLTTQVADYRHDYELDLVVLVVFGPVRGRWSVYLVLRDVDGSPRQTAERVGDQVEKLAATVEQVLMLADGVDDGGP